MDNKDFVPFVIAVDFDGTLFETDYPRIICPNKQLIKNLIWACDILGAKLILWTCREGKELDDAVKACKKYGLEFDAVNDNLPELKEKWGNNPRKIYADIYIDDHNRNFPPIETDDIIVEDDTYEEDSENV
jgi:hypothetical protein